VISEHVSSSSRHLPTITVTKSIILQFRGHIVWMAAIVLHMPYGNVWGEPEGRR
jgi:hypothetical protein